MANEYLKPQIPLKDLNSENYFYPLTTLDQIIIGNSRLSAYLQENNGKLKINNLENIVGEGLTSNRSLFFNANQNLTSSENIFINNDSLAINKTSITDGYNFEVNGNSYLNGTLLTQGARIQKVTIIPSQDGATAAGWRRCCSIESIYNYGNFLMFLSGGWNSGAPTVATLSFNLRNGQASISIIHCGFVGRISKIRLVKDDSATNKYWLDCYDEGATDSTSALYATFIGNVYINNITTNNEIYSAGVTAAAEIELVSIIFKSGVNIGTTNKIAFYSNNSTISSASRVELLDNYLISNDRNGTTVDVRANGLLIYGQTYGNDAAPMLSNTAGVFRFGDGGPQIIFNTSNNGRGLNAQAGALIFTDHDAAAAGASFHFVSTESTDNNGGSLTVTAPRFRARVGLTIGQNSDNTGYQLHVNGISQLMNRIDFNHTADGALLRNYYNSTWYNLIRNHNNGNVSISASSSGLYIGYENTNSIYCVRATRIQYNTPNLFLKDTNTAADTYSIIRFGNHSNDNGAFIFLNGPSRAADGGANTFTIRNNIGNLRLNNITYVTGQLHIQGGMNWPAPQNIICTYTANNQECSFDLTSGSYTGCYWHVWSGKNSGSILQCFNDDRHSWAFKLYGAVWNDYAEFRETKQEIEPGRCIVETGKGDLILSTKRLQEGCEIVSDTFGFAIGQSKQCNTPTAASGRVLAYPYEDKNLFKPGKPVCSGPNGTISIMTDKEARLYPWCIIGTVSEIPDYKEWQCGDEKTEPLKVNGRIWIRIR